MLDSSKLNMSILQMRVSLLSKYLFLDDLQYADFNEINSFEEDVLRSWQLIRGKRFAELVTLVDNLIVQ